MPKKYTDEERAAAYARKKQKEKERYQRLRLDPNWTLRQKARRDTPEYQSYVYRYRRTSAYKTWQHQYNQTEKRKHQERTRKQTKYLLSAIHAIIQLQTITTNQTQ